MYKRGRLQSSSCQEGSYPLARRLPRCWVIWLSGLRRPTRCSWPFPPPVDSAEQLLPRSYRSVLSQLALDPVLLLLRWLGRRPYMPDCHATDHVVDHLFGCPTNPNDLASVNLWTAPLQVTQFLAGLPQFGDLSLQQIDFDSFPLNPHSRR